MKSKVQGRGLAGYRTGVRQVRGEAKGQLCVGGKAGRVMKSVKHREGGLSQWR